MPKSYSLQAAFGDDPEHRYRGCGNGWIQVAKATNTVVEMSYAQNPEKIQREQNIAMCDDAGAVLKEDARYIWYRANFSCYTACLF